MTRARETAGPCPVCGAEGGRFRFTAHDLHSLIPGEHALFSCRACSHVFVDPQPTPEEMARHYAGEYWISVEGPENLTPGVWRLVSRVARQHPGGRVLDVGCAAGRKTAALRDAGLQVMGLDPYENACRLARRNHGLETTCAYLQEADLPEASFDAVTFIDVLEHVHDPVGDLRKARSLLRPGGSVYLKVPNVHSWQARLLGRWWAGLDVPRHLHHFTPRSLRRTLELAGFSDIRCTSPPDPLGATDFEVSMVLWLRDVQWARQGMRVGVGNGETRADELEGNVYGGVPRGAKRAFRRMLRNVLYAPLAAENIVGRSVTLIGVGRKAG